MTGEVQGGLLGFLKTWLLMPQALWFLWLIPIVILLYLLKLRRTEVIISSTLLWLKSLHDLTANAPFQRLRKNLLLLLQILILLALVFALARPYMRTFAQAGNSICVLIDNSASMGTQEGQGRRIDQAKERALDVVERLGRGDRMMIATFAEKPDVLCELTDDRVRLRRAIQSIEPVDTGTRVRDALMVAQSMKATVPDMQVYLVSDGRISDLHELSRRVIDFTYLGVGENTRNAGIIAFSVREPEPGMQGDRECFILVHNEAVEAVSTTLSVYFEEQLLAVEEMQLPPRENSELVFSLPELGRGLLRAEIDAGDALDADNKAWLALQPPSMVNVAVVGKTDTTGAFFLQRALALDSRVQLSTFPGEEFTPSDEFDLVIFNGYAPPALPGGTLIFFDAVPEMGGLALSGDLQNPPVVAFEREHPVMRFLNPSNVKIAKARAMAVPDGARSLVSTQGSPLLADVSRGGQQILVASFEVSDSDWPLNLSFPLFMQNLVSWVPRAALAGETSVAAGSPLTIMPEPEAVAAVVETPGGDSVEVALDPMRPTYFADTQETGPYMITAGERRQVVAVNLLDPIESAVAPADTIPMGSGIVQAERGPVRQNKEFWRWLVVAALALLSLEWWLFSRRAWM